MTCDEQRIGRGGRADIGGLSLDDEQVPRRLYRIIWLHTYGCRVRELMTRAACSTPKGNFGNFRKGILSNDQVFANRTALGIWGLKWL